MRSPADLEALVATAGQLALQDGTPDDGPALLIEAGELHAACTDRRCPSNDDVRPDLTARRAR